MTYHDASRQLDYIRQSLSQNKKHVGFFIGAGCPLAVRVERQLEDGQTVNEPIIPDVAGLTNMIATKLKTPTGGEESLYDRLAKLFVEDEKAQFNIENALSMIRSMSQVVGKGAVRGFNAMDLELLDRSICEIISDIVDRNLPTKESPYHDLAIWARSLSRDKPVHIFTTNYDLLMEEALEDESAPYFDGFIGSRNAFFDLGAVENEKLIDPRWLRLWKIHGSINWKLKLSQSAAAGSVTRLRRELPQLLPRIMLIQSLRAENANWIAILALLVRECFGAPQPVQAAALAWLTANIEPSEHLLPVPAATQLESEFFERAETGLRIRSTFAYCRLIERISQ